MITPGRRYEDLASGYRVAIHDVDLGNRADMDDGQQNRNRRRPDDSRSQKWTAEAHRGATVSE